MPKIKHLQDFEGNLNHGWMNHETERLVTLDDIIKEKQQEYHLLHYEERRSHWKKLQVLKQELVPAFISYAHGLIGMRRVIFRRVQQADPWWSTGGQSHPRLTRAHRLDMLRIKHDPELTKFRHQDVSSPA
ncbi:hypothetical protein BCR42DRAFT_444138 [Absidia repens]|uniref:Uncharacterized protein n=1 Tax=Absidia repens TaxID=90262 RepID=A0A1X2HXP4_9FUNG|nr:hypothetical protein BCR42DRAFT_444138 [Absidia repens]